MVFTHNVQWKKMWRECLNRDLWASDCRQTLPIDRLECPPCIAQMIFVLVVRHACIAYTLAGTRETKQDHGKTAEACLGTATAHQNHRDSKCATLKWKYDWFGRV